MDKKSIQTMLGKFIPQYVPNQVVVGVMELLSLFRMSKRQTEENKKHNDELLAGQEYADSRKAFFVPEKYIENQAQWKEVRFGKQFTMAYCGCEVFAVYNALVAMGEEPNGMALADIISRFEQRGAVLGGRYGASPKAAYHYFRKLGYQVQIVMHRCEEELEELGENYETIIATVYNDGQDIYRMIHTVNISKNKRGWYYIHNGYKRTLMAEGNAEYVSDGPYTSLWQALSSMSGGKAEVLLVMGIR